MAEPYSHVGLWTLHGGEAEEGVGWVGGLVGLSSSISFISGLTKEKRSQSSFGSSGILLPPNGARCSTENVGELGTSSPAWRLGHSFVRTQG